MRYATALFNRVTITNTKVTRYNHTKAIVQQQRIVIMKYLLLHHNLINTLPVRDDVLLIPRHMLRLDRLNWW